MDVFIGMAIFICLGVLIFGLVKGFPWFVIQGAMINGPGFLAALYGIFYGVYYGATSSPPWLLLAVMGGYSHTYAAQTCTISSMEKKCLCSDGSSKIRENS
jgi:hypothetical protein